MEIEDEVFGLNDLPGFDDHSFFNLMYLVNHVFQSPIAISIITNRRTSTRFVCLDNVNRN